MSGLALEEYELLEDSKYRAYVASVDKALRNFESTSEWADLISTLGKLSKVLLSHMKYPVVPRRIIISKRLAQCLHPALPSGVHLKALEIYDVIFKCMGTNRLSQELFIYSAGLFPLFSAAAMNVRSALLMIYENHFVPLGTRLRPGLNGFLAATLSGLEEGSDHLERTSLLLHRVGEGVGQTEFFGCLWECILNNSNVRLPAITHITNCFNKKLCTEDQLHILGTNIDVMVCGLCRALEDNAVLVQRAALDLTLLLLPMHNTQLLRNDLTAIVTSALTVLLRRDMSLNRRLYAWLLGSEVNLSLLSSEHPVVKRLESLESDSRGEKKTSEGDSYFQAFSKLLLIDAFINLLKIASKSKEPPDLRPYKIIIPLLDKPEIGPHILDFVFLDLLRCFYHVCESLQDSSASNEKDDHLELQPLSTSSPLKVSLSRKNSTDGNRFVNELTKNILLVFSALQASYPWYRLLRLLEDACLESAEKNKENEHVNEVGEIEDNMINRVGHRFVRVGEICNLLQYMMTILPLDTQQHLQGAQMSEVLSSVTSLFTDFMESLSPCELLAGLELCKSLLEKLIPSASLSSHHSRTDSQSSIIGALQAYSLPFSRRPPTLNELLCADSPCADNGIIQIGIEAGKDPPGDEGEEKEQEEASLEDILAEKECIVDFNESEDSHSETKSKESVDQSEKDVEEQGRVSPLKNSTVVRISPKKKLPSESFETDLPLDVLERTNITSEEGFESALGSPDLLETSFLYKYIKDFQKMFLNFVEKLLIHQSSSIYFLENLLSLQISELSNIKKLKLLMKECIRSDSKQESSSNSERNTMFDGSTHFDDKEYAQLLTCVKLKSSSGKYLQVFKTACAVLVELSSMPAAATFPWSSNSNKQSLPPWLIGLLACVVGGPQTSAQFSQTAISTFLELVALSQSDLSAWKLKSSSCNNFEEQGVTALRMLPLLMPTHTHTLLYHTYIFQFMTRELWSNLDISKRECHLVSSELLLQLHGLSLTPGSPKSYLPQNLSVVEREILKCLTTTNQSVSLSNSKKKIYWTSNSISCGCDSGAIIRWITLWQVSRSLSKSIIQSYPYLNRCLFLVVERLRSESVLERSYSQNWLTESLNCGDLGRILDPLLVFLLHPHTRRVSVQHVNIEKISSKDSKSHSNMDIQDEMISESQIFAISSVGGEVMYHISKGPFSKGRNESSTLPAFKKQTLALTSLSKESSNKLETREIKLSNYEVPVSSQNTGLPISLMINPFSQHPWIDIEDLAKISRSGSVSKLSNRGIPNGQNKSVYSEKCNLQTKEPTRKWTSKDLAESILNDIIDKSVFIGSRDGASDNIQDSFGSGDSSTLDNAQGKETTLHPLHSHMLLYTQLVDVGQCLYGLNLIKNILDSQPKLFLLSLASTSINSQVNSSPLLILLARHRRSVFGEGFEGGNVSEMVGQFRSTMYLQVVITVCLYFIRSYYPQQPHLHVQQEHLHDNRELQVVAAEVLEALFTQLIPLVADSPRGFSPYVRDLLNKCKVQKCVLHCLLSTAHLMKERNSEDNVQNIRTLTQDVLEYNFGTTNNSQTIPQEQPYLVCLIDLTLALIKLEDILLQNKSDPLPCDAQSNLGSKMFSLPSLRYVFGHPIPSQPMFLWALVLVLSQKNLRHFHSSWINFFTSSLPHTGPALPLNCLRLMTLICSLLEDLATYYRDDTLPSIAPSDYTLHLLSGLTNIVHFCLLDPSNYTSTLPTSSSTSPSPPSVTSQSPGQILFNLLHVFSPASEVLEASVDTSALDPMICTKKTLLSHLPRLVSALLSLWVNTSPRSGKQAFILGNRQAVRQQIIELLSPICHHHTPHLLAALGVVWQGVSEENSFVSSNGSSLRKASLGSMWKCSKHQRSLVEMLAALRVLPLHSLVENVKQVFRNPPVIEGSMQKNPLEVSILQLFYLYLKETASTNQLSVCWGPFLSLVREGILCLPPPALLVLLACLNEFVQRSPTVQDKKEIKEQQDVAVRLLDAVSTIAGSRLEATTWLRRNLTVRPDSSTDDDDVEKSTDVSSYSVAALSVLADLLAPLLDVLYSSEEKERVIPLLINITSNVIPYLKNHSSSNMSAFHACSQLLSSLSSYQYTLKAWRKDVLELLLDPNTFRMLPETLPHWRSLIDNLCTHDKTIFKELLSRISMSQGGSLNLFVSKEAEYETRAGLLKRLAFTIFCSETDQYLRLIPDIQERLTEVTRLGQVVPGLVAQVFLCFRVLLLRVSSRGTTSLWPIVITELVQVLLMMEQELSTDTDQFSNKKHSSSHLKRLSTLDSRWVVSTQNGLHAHNHPAWLSLYFSACKLLDLMVALPASHLPQFQMYRWAFVGTEKPNTNELKTKFEGMGYLLQSCEFVPHIARIAKLMSQKLRKGKSSSPPSPPPVLPHRPGYLLLTGSSITSLMDLHPFFNTLTTSGPLINGAASPNTPPRSSPYNGPHVVTLSPGTSLKHVEAVIERDFLEPIFG